MGATGTATTKAASEGASEAAPPTGPAGLPRSPGRKGAPPCGCPGLRALALVGAAVWLGGCGILYTNIRTPRAYRSATPVDVKATPSDAVANGRACARSLLFLVAWGDTGYAAATEDALRDHPDAVLYDVRSDMQVHSYALGAYTEVCTLITGRVGRL
jgi:hypothetical protein